jgi:ABC-2 type transport system permease protein
MEAPMSVYKRAYKPYAGGITSPRTRFLVISRYGLESLFSSRLLIGLLVACYMFPLFAVLAIYLHHNLGALALLQVKPQDLIPINNEFFSVYLSFQSVFAFLLTAYAGPGLISPDLTNNALPLYLCRPISRAEYVLGKMAVLFIPLSFITWIPGLLLWSLQAGLDDTGWGRDNLHIAWAVFAGSWLWILLLSLLATALSAWVRWRLAASALLFGIFFISAAFAAIVNEVLRTKSGFLLNLGYLVGTIISKMLQISPRRTLLGELFDIRRGDEVPLWACWLMLALISGVCILLLNKRLRGREVAS